MKTHGEAEIQLHALFVSALDGGKRSASTSGSINPAGETLVPTWQDTGGARRWGEESVAPARNETQVIQATGSYFTDWGIPPSYLCNCPRA